MNKSRARDGVWVSVRVSADADDGVARVLLCSLTAA